MSKPSFLKHYVVIIATLLSVCAYLGSAQAIPLYNKSSSKNTSAATITPAAPPLEAKAYLLMEADSGKILAEKAMNERLDPASLTKIMTLYLTFEALQNGQVNLDDKVTISKKAWRMKGSLMFLEVGTTVTLEQLIEGVIVASGNDASVALAEYIAGTEPTFVQMMNQTAAQLGMKSTHYMDATGLPNAEHYTTAYDLGLLTRAIIYRFPNYYNYFKQKWLRYNNIKQPNRNRLLWRDPSVDGLKTGHTNAAGYCLIASAKRDNRRLISIIMGANSDAGRVQQSQALLNYGFRFYKTYSLFNTDEVVTQDRIWLGKRKQMDFGVAKNLSVTIPNGQYSHLSAAIHLDKPLSAPIKKGQRCGQLNIMLDDKIITTTALVALQDNPKGNFFSRTWDHLMMYFKG